jgi:hypothetical protein
MALIDEPADALVVVEPGAGEVPSSTAVVINMKGPALRRSRIRHSHRVVALTVLGGPGQPNGGCGPRATYIADYEWLSISVQYSCTTRSRITLASRRPAAGSGKPPTRSAPSSAPVCVPLTEPLPDF